MTDFVTLEDLLSFTELLGAGPVRDVGLLSSAAARPAATAFGEDAYPGVELKAAALIHSLTCNHPLVDGNKRLALVAGVAFLHANDRSFVLTQDEAFDLIMGVAEGRLDVPDIAARLHVADE